jgi:Flp pilus assembly protein TadG
MLVIVGMAAFAVDIGFVVYTQSELQNAADAAALAGASELMKGSAKYQWPPNQAAAAKAKIMSDATANALAQAKRVAGLNKASDVSSLTLLDGDVSYGYLDKNGTFSPTPPDARFPNSIVVTLRRDGQANGPVGLFFGRVFGKENVPLTATSRATTGADVTSFSSSRPVNGSLLPVALNINVWNQFVAAGTSSSSDNYVTPGSDGNPQLHIYPVHSLYSGDGLVNIGPPSNDSPTYSVWIDNGPSSSDLGYLRDHGQLPVGLSDPQSWGSAPGMHSTLIEDFNSIIGQPRVIPLYDPSKTVSGGGYPIVGFAGVTIRIATGSGWNMDISIQPMLTIDPTGLGNPLGGSSGPPTFAYTAPQLTQ